MGQVGLPGPQRETGAGLGAEGDMAFAVHHQGPTLRADPHLEVGHLDRPRVGVDPSGEAPGDDGGGSREGNDIGGSDGAIEERPRRAVRPVGQRQHAFGIGPRQDARAIQRRLDPDLAVVDRAGVQAERHHAVRRVDLAGEAERPDQRLGLRIPRQTGRAQHRLAVFAHHQQGPVMERGVAEADVIGIGGGKARQNDRSVIGHHEGEVGLGEIGVHEDEFATQQGGQGELDIQPGGRGGGGPRRGPDHRDVAEPEDRPGQQLDVDRAAHRDLGPEQLGQARLDRGPVGVPVHEIGTDERGRQHDDQHDRQNGQAFAHGSGLGRQTERGVENRRVTATCAAAPR